VIFVRSKRAGKSVMSSVTKMIEKQQNLAVSGEKHEGVAVTRIRF
ncbi:group II intron reverse transcriptase/maturase, partial [Staphylococcus pseudintermedius]